MRRTREDWGELIERWGRSGLTARAFAAEAGVNAHTLTYWKWRLRKDTRSPTLSGFVEVVASSSERAAEPLEVVLEGGQRIRVPAGFDAEALRRVLDILERR